MTSYIIFGVDKLPRQCVCYIEGYDEARTSKRLSRDPSPCVVSVKYNGNEYYYVRNGQGDIVKLIDSTGTTVVEYIYNTWGKKVTTTGSMAETLGRWQPFRYRGYVYDYETGFYYLQSRYYDPTTGRFISADVLLSTGQGVLGHNCYAYCLGNPVSRADEGGCTSGHVGNLYRTWVETYTGRDIPVRGFERKPDRYYLTDFYDGYYLYGEEMKVYSSLKKGETTYYRGVRVVISSSDSSYALFGVIHIHESQMNDPNTLRHEYGHIIQEKVLGEIKYCIFIGLPSYLCHDKESFYNDYESLPWERSNEFLGQTVHEEGYYKKGSAILSTLYFLLALVL